MEHLIFWMHPPVVAAAGQVEGAHHQRGEGEQGVRQAQHAAQDQEEGVH